MKRIVHIVGKMDRAGAETMIMNLYRTIDRTQFQFDFVTFSEEKGDYDEEIKSLGGKVFHIAEKNPIKRMFRLKALLEAHPDYQIVHAHTLLSNAFHVWAAKMANVPYRIVHAHSTNDISHRSFLGRVYKKGSVLLINNYTTHFIGCGTEPAQFLFPRQKGVLILPNSIDTKYFATIGEKEEEYINQEFGTTSSCLKIIQLGRLQTVKNHSFSLKIAEKLKEKGIEFQMFFVGQGDLKKEIAAQIKEKNLAKQVHLVGLRSDIPQLLAGADVMIMPSLHEGFPVVLVEAQSVGLPSLVSDSVSPEVDLNVGLVEFESLHDPIDHWIEKLISLKSKERLTKDIRLKKLGDQGFDIYTSVKILSSLYESLN